MPEKLFADKLPRWLSFTIQSLFMFIAVFSWFAFIIVTPFLYYGSTTTQIILWTLLIYQYTICSEPSWFREFNRQLKFEDYFPVYKMIFEDKIIPEKKQLFCSHPHGLMVVGFGLAHYIEPKFRNNQYLRANILSYLPFSGIYFLLFGTQSVERDNFLRIMKEERNIYFVPGGFECATITKYGEDKVYIKNRKGFIKYALQFGYTVHPMYCFGENKIYRGLGLIFVFYVIFLGVGQKIGHFLNKYNIPAIIPYTFWFMLPYRPKLYPVVGKGIEFPEIDKPTKDDVDKYHQIYVNALVALFNKYKEKFEASSELKLF